MEGAFLQAMQETVMKPGWQGLDESTLQRLVGFCLLSDDPEERDVWTHILAYLRPGASPPKLGDASSLHRIAASAVIIGSFVNGAQWTLFRMPEPSGLVLADRPVAILGRAPYPGREFGGSLFFTMPLSPRNLLLGVPNSPLAEIVASGTLSYSFLGTLWGQAFGSSDFSVTDPAVFQAHLAYNFGRTEIYARTTQDLLDLRRLVGRILPPRVLSRRPRYRG
jgi:hypothetical protein